MLELERGRPLAAFDRLYPIGALAQLGERLICIQEVIGSIPIGSTTSCLLGKHDERDIGRRSQDLREMSAPGRGLRPVGWTARKRLGR